MVSVWVWVTLCFGMRLELAGKRPDLRSQVIRKLANIQLAVGRTVQVYPVVDVRVRVRVRVRNVFEPFMTTRIEPRSEHF